MRIGHRNSYSPPPGSVAGSILVWDTNSNNYVDSSRPWACGPAPASATAITLANTTPSASAAAGNQQGTPLYQMLGQGWNSGSSTSVLHGMRMYELVTAGNPPVATFYIDMCNNGTGTWANRITLNSSGTLTVTSGVVSAASISATGTNGVVSAGRLATSGNQNPGAGYLAFAYSTVAAGGSAPTFLNAPAAAAQQLWIKLYYNNTAYVFPVWSAA